MANNTTSTPAENTPVFNSTDPKTPLISVNIAGITKLSTSNYITWRLQVRALLEAYELQCFIEESSTAPTPTVITADTQTTNPLYAPWKRQYHILYSAILGTLTLGVQQIVSRVATTNNIWEILAKTYGKPSRGHIKQIKQQLKKITKGFLLIDEYMSCINTKADQLALLGSPIEHEDLLDIITDGVGEDYKHVVDMVNGRDVPIKLEELHEKLINRELYLISTAQLDGNYNHVSVNAANFQPRRDFNSNRGRAFTRQRRSYQSNNYRGSYNNYNRGAYNNNMGRGSPLQYLGKCQFCDSQGHVARSCPQLAGYTASRQENNSIQVNTRYTTSDHGQWNPQAHYTTVSPSNSSQWLL